MLLGKRPRPPMKRTTSMNEIKFDLNLPAGEDPQNPFTHKPVSVAGDSSSGEDPQSNFNRKPVSVAGDSSDGFDERFFSSLVSPKPNRRHSSDLSPASFLRSCGLCKRRLVPGRDIYMYKGDAAFCSSECRQQQMNRDERKEKCFTASKKLPETSSGAGAAVKSAKTETVAAV